LWLHLAATLWGFTTILARLNCPLTTIEDRARRRAGQPGLPRGGFIDHYLDGVVYPERYAVLVPWLVALAVIVSWVGAYLRWRARGRTSVTASGPFSALLRR
jgi:hypothetical protein